MARRALAVALCREQALHRRVDGSVAWPSRRGETFALVGESGSGKSTVARAISGLIGAAAGAHPLQGRAAARPGRASAPPSCGAQIQYIFQNPDASLNPRTQGRRDPGPAAASCSSSSMRATVARARRPGARRRSPRCRAMRSAIPTSSPAASASASPSPAPWSPSRRCCSATRCSRRSTSRSRPISSSCCAGCAREHQAGDAVHLA